MKIRSKKTVLILTMLMLCLLATTAQAAKVSKNGGTTKRKAKAVTVNTKNNTYVGKFTATKKTYWYKFTTLSFDAFYTFTPKNNSIDEAVHFYLLDKSEDELWHDYFYKNGSAVKNLKLKKKTTYYVRIENNYSGKGYAQFTLRARKDKIADVRQKATTMKVSSTMNGTMDGDGDYDWFKFKPAKTAYYTFIAKNLNADGAVNFTLCDQYEEEILRDYFYKNGEFNKVTPVKLKAGKWYYICVNNSGNYTGNYRVSVRKS